VLSLKGIYPSFYPGVNHPVKMCLENDPWNYSRQIDIEDKDDEDDEEVTEANIRRELYTRACGKHELPLQTLDGYIPGAVG